jgi:hypothetical protein
VRVFDDHEQRSTGFREQQLAQRLERSALQRCRIERDQLSVTGGDVERVMEVATGIRIQTQLLERRVIFAATLSRSSSGAIPHASRTRSRIGR